MLLPGFLPPVYDTLVRYTTNCSLLHYNPGFFWYNQVPYLSRFPILLHPGFVNNISRFDIFLILYIQVLSPWVWYTSRFLLTLDLVYSHSLFCYDIQILLPLDPWCLTTIGLVHSPHDIVHPGFLSCYIKVLFALLCWYFGFLSF